MNRSAIPKFRVHQVIRPRRGTCEWPKLLEGVGGPVRIVLGRAYAAGQSTICKTARRPPLSANAILLTKFRRRRSSRATARFLLRISICSPGDMS